jgi:DNA polymerase III subunit delta
VKVYADKLAAAMERTHPVYLVSGDEPLLVQEACDQIRLGLKKSGYSERELFHADGQFDWGEVLFSANSMSLFAEQKILEIRLPGGKPGDKGASALKTFADNPPEGTTMLLVLPKLDAASQRSQWFKALEGIGVFVQLWPITVAEMPRWLGDRLRRVGLRADRDALDALVDRVEGNLLAAIQEIERLRLVSTDGKVGVREVMDSVADSSRYDVYTLIDAAVAQDAVRALRILRGLQAAGAEVLFVVTMLARELRSLAEISAMIESGRSIDSAIGAARVWPKRKAAVTTCLRSRQLADLLVLVREVAIVDKTVKGLLKGDPWIKLTDIVVGLAGRPALPPTPGRAS